MHALIGLVGAHKVLAGVLAAGLVLGGSVVSVAATAAARGPQTASVTRVVDGDTVDVTIGGDERRVRLLNVDTPETVHPDEDVDCLGPEATQFLTDLLPTGTQVRLEYDVERQDRYGRDLAGVFLGQDLINAEIARAGLGVAVLYEPNDRFHKAVVSAQQQAELAGRGLFDPAIACSLPAQIQGLESLAEDLLALEPATGAALTELEAQERRLAEAAAAGLALLEVFDGQDDAFPLRAHDGGKALRAIAAQTYWKIAQARLSSDAAITAEQARVETERLAAEQERIQAERLEAERLAVEEAARRAAQEQAAADAARRAASSRSGSSSGSSTSGSGSSSGGYDGYTGCRAYSGHTPNAIDKNGRPYTKIDCTTRLPIG